MTANKPADTDIKVYYKVKSTYDSVGTFDDKNWTLMEQLSPSAATFSNNTDEFLEYVYVPQDSNTSTSSGTRQIVYTNSSNIVFDSFNEYAIKIVFLSSNNCIVPRAADLRVIATE